MHHRISNSMCIVTKWNAPFNIIYNINTYRTATIRINWIRENHCLTIDAGKWKFNSEFALVEWILCYMIVLQMGVRMILIPYHIRFPHFWEITLTEKFIKPNKNEREKIRQHFLVIWSWEISHLSLFLLYFLVIYFLCLWPQCRHHFKCTKLSHISKPHSFAVKSFCI